MRRHCVASERVPLEPGACCEHLGETAEGLSVVAARDPDHCMTSIYTWRPSIAVLSAHSSSSEDEDEEITTTRRSPRLAATTSRERGHERGHGRDRGRRRAIQLVTLPSLSATESFQCQQLLVPSQRYALLLATDGRVEVDRHDGWLAHFDLERERTSSDCRLVLQTASHDSIGRPRITQLALSGSEQQQQVVSVVGVGRGLVFSAQLDRRQPSTRHLLTVASSGQKGALKGENAARLLEGQLLQCVARCEDGRVATGDRSGHVRLSLELGLKPRLSFLESAPIMALAATPDGRWLAATCRRHVAVYGPFEHERGWHDLKADVGQVVCDVSAEERQRYAVPADTPFCDGHFVGYIAGQRSGCVAVALGTLLVVFPLYDRHPDILDNDDAVPRSIEHTSRRIVQQRIAAAAPIHCGFDHCRIYELDGAIAAHAPSNSADAETLALEQTLIALEL